MFIGRVRRSAEIGGLSLLTSLIIRWRIICPKLMPGFVSCISLMLYSIVKSSDDDEPFSPSGEANCTDCWNRRGAPSAPYFLASSDFFLGQSRATCPFFLQYAQVLSLWSEEVFSWVFLTSVDFCRSALRFRHSACRWPSFLQ